MRIIEIRIKEPAKKIFPNDPESLESRFNHPQRWRYTNCWLENEGPGGFRHECTLMPVAGPAPVKFLNGVCLNYLGEFYAEILGEVSIAQIHYLDRYEEIEE